MTMTSCVKCFETTSTASQQVHQAMEPISKYLHSVPCSYRMFCGWTEIASSKESCGVVVWVCTRVLLVCSDLPNKLFKSDSNLPNKTGFKMSLDHFHTIVLGQGGFRYKKKPSSLVLSWLAAHSYPLSIALASASSGMRLIIPQFSRAIRSSSR